MSDHLVEELNELFNRCLPDGNGFAESQRVLEVLNSVHPDDENATHELENLFRRSANRMISRSDFVSLIMGAYKDENAHTEPVFGNEELSHASSLARESGQGDYLDRSWLHRRTRTPRSSASSSDSSQHSNVMDSPWKVAQLRFARLEARNNLLNEELLKCQEDYSKAIHDNGVNIAMYKKRVEEINAKYRSLKEEFNIIKRKAETAEDLETEKETLERKMKQLKDELARNKDALKEANEQIVRLVMENAELKAKVCSLNSQLRNEEQLLALVDQLRTEKHQILENVSNCTASAIPNFVELGSDDIDITPHGIAALLLNQSSNSCASISEELSAINSNFLLSQDKAIMCDVPQLVDKGIQTLVPAVRSLAVETSWGQEPLFTQDKATMCERPALVDRKTQTPLPTFISQTVQASSSTSEKAVSCCLNLRRVQSSKTQTPLVNRRSITIQTNVSLANEGKRRLSLRIIVLLIFALFFCVVFVKNPWTDERINFVVCQTITDFFRNSIGYRPHPY